MNDSNTSPEEVDYQSNPGECKSHGGTWSQPSWWKDFTKNLGSNFVSEFGDGGSVNAFFNAFNGGGSSHLLPDLPPGSGPDDFLRQGGGTLASVYWINKGLTVPLRSTIYRGYLEGSEAAASYFVIVDAYARIAEGGWAEGKDILNGTCH